MVESTKVPHGFKVVAFRPSARAFFASSESGVRVLNLGDDVAGAVQALAAIERFVPEEPNTGVIWIFSRSVLRALSGNASFLLRLGETLAEPADIRHFAVFPDDTEPENQIAGAFKSASAEVHFAAHDGACFVEVHRPDGIVVGFPGPAF